MTDYKPPFFDFSSSSSARVFGVPVYGKDSWLRDWVISPIYRIGNRMHHWLWELRYRNPFGRHQYHLVNTHLDPGYYDCDQLMLYACFSLLRRYVEDECGGVDKLDEFTNELLGPSRDRDEIGMGDALDHQAHGQNEAAALYRWWMTDRPAREELMDRLTDLLYSNGVSRMVTEGSTVRFEYVGQLTQEERTAKRKELWQMMEDGPKEDNAMLKRLIDIRGGLWT